MTKCAMEDRTITIPRELMDFAKRRVTDMIFFNEHKPLRDICAEAYLLACNDMTQLRDRKLI